MIKQVYTGWNSNTLGDWHWKQNLKFHELMNVQTRVDMCTVVTCTHADGYVLGMVQSTNLHDVPIQGGH